MRRSKFQIAAEVNPESFQGWGKLEPHEQDRVRAETASLETALKMEYKSKLGQGEHLTKLRDILEPKRMFIQFLDEVFHMSRATAYRYIDIYVVAQTSLPKPVLEMAIQRGTKINPQVMVENPPPKTEDKSKILAYLDHLNSRSRVEVAKSPDTLMKECVNFVTTRWKMLPNNQREKTRFMRSLVGMLMTKFGVASDQNFSPVAIPDSFLAQRGRPKLAA